MKIKTLWTVFSLLFFCTLKGYSQGESNSRRRPWFNPPCCPTSMVRFLPEIGALIYAKDNQGIYINQYIGNEANIQINDKYINLRMQTNYPWEEKVDIHIAPESTESFKLHVRIPGWTRGEFIPGSDL